jgi:8-amino-7-oxononanoate synthase
MDFQKELGKWTDQSKLGGRDIFRKALDWEAFEKFGETGFYPFFQPVEKNQGPVAIYQGKEVIMLGSNNYLGLTTHPKVREAAEQAIKDYGTAMTGSRFLNGTMPLHEELEERLADFLGKPAALVFTTGYQANLGMLTALINEQAVAVVDRMAHASIHDGCRMMDGEELRFNNNDMEDLDRVMSGIPQDKGSLICVDGVYSMEGHLADVPGVVKIAKKYGVRVAVDDAHGIGVMGPGGRGTSHHFAVQDDVDLIIGTFSKSLASTGGFVAGEKRVINFIKHFGRPMIFSASLPPSCTAAALAALEVLIAEPERAEQTRNNAHWMKEELSKIGYDTGTTESAVVPVRIGESLMTFMVWKELLDAGIYTNPVIYPAVPKGEGCLRTSYLATHEQKHLDQALEIFHQVGKNYEICK